jgi:hypothetical protein
MQTGYLEREPGICCQALKCWQSSCHDSLAHTCSGETTALRVGQWCCHWEDCWDCVLFTHARSMKHVLPWSLIEPEIRSKQYPLFFLSLVTSSNDHVFAKVMLRLMVIWPIFPGVSHHLGSVNNFSFLLDIFRQLLYCHYGHPLWGEDGPVFTVSCCWVSPVHSLSGSTFSRTHDQIFLSQVWGTGFVYFICMFLRPMSIVIYMKYCHMLGMWI